VSALGVWRRTYLFGENGLWLPILLSSESDSDVHCS
jgi:hypothetical protein